MCEDQLGPSHLVIVFHSATSLCFAGPCGTSAARNPLFERALAIHEQLQMRCHPAGPNVLNSLAVLHNEMGEPAAGLPLQRRALGIYQEHLGHPSIVDALDNLGCTMPWETALPRCRCMRAHWPSGRSRWVPPIPRRPSLSPTLLTCSPPGGSLRLRRVCLRGRWAFGGRSSWVPATPCTA